MDHNEMFDSGGYNCAESVLAGVTGSMDAVNLATGFGGGIGRSGATCGAVTGAVMALGQVWSARNSDSEAAYGELQDGVRQLLDEFSSEFGSTLCRELIPYDLSTDEGRSAFSANDDGRSRCHEFVHRAVELARRILADRGLDAAS